MAYVNQLPRNRRTATLAAVAGLHAALLYALITGFAATVWDKVDAVLPSRNYKADPPPPAPEPSVEPSVAPEPRPFVVPDPAIDLNPVTDNKVVVDLVPSLPTPLPTTPALGPSPSPSPSFAPKAAMPLGSPGKWATTDDYPPRALREGREGVARFRVTVGADGRVRNCEITASSGSPDLDRATCDNVARRARFVPATDASGAKVGGSYSNAVKWVIPQ